MKELTLMHAWKIITLVLQKSNLQTSPQRWKSNCNYNLGMDDNQPLTLFLFHTDLTFFPPFLALFLHELLKSKLFHLSIRNLYWQIQVCWFCGQAYAKLEGLILMAKKPKPLLLKSLRCGRRKKQRQKIPSIAKHLEPSEHSSHAAKLPILKARPNESY